MGGLFFAASTDTWIRLHPLHPQGLADDVASDSSQSAIMSAKPVVNKPWLPQTWVDVVEPILQLLNELLSRFQQQQDFERLSPGALRALAEAEAVIAQRVVGTPSTSGSRWRRLNETTRAIRRFAF